MMEMIHVLMMAVQHERLHAVHESRTHDQQSSPFSFASMPSSSAS